MRLGKVRNNSGVVLIIVMIIIFLMSIVCATIFSQSMSEVKTAHAQVNNIVAEEFAKGLWWQTYSKSYNSATGQWSPTLINSCFSCNTNLNGQQLNAHITSPNSSLFPTPEWVNVSY